MTPHSNYNPYLDPNKHIAAELRRLFRAFQADDREAVDLCHRHFWDYFENWLLNQHLVGNPRWDRRTVDYIKGRVEIRPPNWYSFSGGDAYFWLLHDDGDLRGAGSEPVEFELELCAKSGAFRRYALRLGDPLHFENQRTPPRKWAFMFCEGKARSLFDSRPPDRIELAYPLAEQQPEPDFESDDSHAPFIDSNADDIVTVVRQLSRDVAAQDAEAIDLSLFYLRHHFHLRQHSRLGLRFLSMQE